MREVRKKAIKEIKDLLERSSGLQAQSLQCHNDMKKLNEDIKALEEQLREEIKTKVILKHALSFVGTVMKVIPFYQPELGVAGGLIQAGSELATNPPGDEGFKALDVVLSGVAKGGKYALDKQLTTLQKEVADADKSADKLEARKYVRGKRAKFQAGNEAAAKAMRNGVKSQRATASKLSKASTALGENTDSMVKDIKGIFYPKQEVDGLLAQFEAADPLFVELAQKIRKHKELLSHVVQELIEVFSEIQVLQALVVEAHQGEAEMYQALGYAEERHLPSSVLAVANGLQGAAIADLIKQRYLLTQAYQNLFFETLEPDSIPENEGKDNIPPLDIHALLDAVQKNVAAAVSSSGNPADPDDWSATREEETYKAFEDAMLPILDGLREQIASAIREKARGGIEGVSSDNLTRVSFYLSTSQLAALNSKDAYQVYIDLSRIKGMEIENDRVVIGDIKVSDIHYDVTGENTTKSPKLSVVHNGSGVMKSRNALYQVRYGNNVNVQRWSFQVDARDPNKQKPISISDGEMAKARTALLKSARSALKETGEISGPENIAAYFTSLPAYTELQILQDSTRSEEMAKVTRLRFDIDVYGANDQNSTRAFDISVDSEDSGDTPEKPYPVNISIDGGENWTEYALPLFLPVPDGTEMILRARRLVEDGVIALADASGVAPLTGPDQWTIKMEPPADRSYVKTLKAKIGPLDTNW